MQELKYRYIKNMLYSILYLFVIYLTGSANTCPSSCNCTQTQIYQHAINQFTLICQERYNHSEMESYLKDTHDRNRWPHTKFTFLNSSFSEIPAELCSLGTGRTVLVEVTGDNIKGLSANNDIISCPNLFSNLIVSYSHLQYVDFDFLSNFTKLRRIDLSHNRLTYIHPKTFTWPNLRNLIIVDLTYNQIKEIDMWTFQLPAYKLGLEKNNWVNVSLNSIETIRNTVGFNVNQLPEGEILLYLDLRYNKIHSVKRFLDLVGISHISQMRRFWHISFLLKYNQMYCDCDMHTFMNQVGQFIPGFLETVAEQLIMVPCYKPERLKYKLIRYIKMTDFNCYQDNCTTHDECVCVFTPENNTLRVVCEGISLTGLPNITKTATNIELYLSNNNIGTITKTVYFSNITILDISNNSITDVNRDIIPPKVKYLLLHENKITSVPRELEEIDLKELTLRLNPIKCDCYAGWMKDWLMSSAHVTDAKGVACSEPSWNAGKLVMEVEGYDFACYKISIIVKVVPILAISIVFLVITILLIVYRDYVRLFLFTRFGLRLGYKYDDVTRKYDVFLSYNSEDEAWVDELTEKLESHQPPYRVCIHYKEFEPGLPIAQNIVNCIDATQCTVMIVSKHFLESDWCKYEFRVAHQSALIEKRTKVIVVLYDDTPTSEMENDLKMYLKTNTYLKKDDPRFWQKLLMSLPKPSGRVNPMDIDVVEYTKTSDTME